MTCFDDLDTDPMASKAADIRKNAHIVNGGESSATCPSCKGTGHFRAYTGRIVGNCFKCKGSGTVTNRIAGAAKAKVTREQNLADKRAAWVAEHESEFAYISRRAEKSSFFANMLSSLDQYGSLTDRQLEAVRRCIAEDEVKREEWKQERANKSGDVDISGITKLFETATDNDIKRPIFRAEGIEISKASANGRNAGALYVKSNDDVYLGKIVNGEFLASREATADTLSQLRAVAIDPTAEAIKYGRRTGRCSCCGRGLVDPVSIRAAIGPICAEKWGLDWVRAEAADQLAQEG